MEDKFYAVSENVLKAVGVSLHEIDRVIDPVYLRSGVSILSEKYKYETDEQKKIAILNKIAALRFALCERDSILSEIE
jgi:hypothetical protein